ncbi:NADPH:adrenodoxin oxidoreductase, mitochondrial [Zancudomyces culisetae]|uniref:NADPH:adrenodoxin oxidoreductase, mitochondrial n=1 Tax=Zancudomyces culisetae TaxID=1213189 RepID=A0A1R1PL69_ZANCU|nr:NADPH:adrenodoxin oxidoreductase, mitochondrial [Zancudomyces culisetae]|eukprot:OMH81706.1 NADPH:adrenodoxin oxidoreductase, mitochondrial [Zancudomyces culisetae]
MLRIKILKRVARNPTAFIHQRSVSMITVSTKKDYVNDSDKIKKNYVAVVGSGPAGYYTALKLLENKDIFGVDIFEKMPVPFGLVRYGVAPDHPEVKDERVRFFGNIGVGKDKDICVEDLKNLYHAVVLSYGAETSRNLNIPGEEGIIIQDSTSKQEKRIGGVYRARDFVNYYNGYPEAQTKFPVDFLSGSKNKKVAIFGMGNVSLDVARILLKDPESLATTDISKNALEMLHQSKVSHVDIIARRGPLNIAFTTKEVRELLKLPNVKLDMDKRDIMDSLNNEISQQELKSNRPLGRMLGVITKYLDSQVAKSPAERVSDTLADVDKRTKTWALKFMLSPKRITFPNSDPNQNPLDFSQSIELEKNAFVGAPTLRSRPVGTNQFINLDYNIAFQSIGYKSIGISGVPFNSKKNIIPNVSGRVIEYTEEKGEGQILPGLYVSGWIKTGPTGILANTMYDSFDTASAIIKDLDLGLLEKEHVFDRKVLIDQRLKALGVFDKCVDYNMYLKINESELETGRELGKASEKISSIDEMLRVARS